MHAEKWAKGSPGLPIIVGSPKEYRDLPHFKSEIGDEKKLFFQAKTFFLALKSEIVDAKKLFSHDKIFFFFFKN